MFLRVQKRNPQGKRLREKIGGLGQARTTQIEMLGRRRYENHFSGNG